MSAGYRSSGKYGQWIISLIEMLFIYIWGMQNSDKNIGFLFANKIQAIDFQVMKVDGINTYFLLAVATLLLGGTWMKLMN